MAKKLRLAEDTHALKKLDTLIQKEDPYRDLPGGGAYVAAERQVSTITNMYREEKKEKPRILQTVLIIAAMTIVVALLIVGMIMIVRM